MTPQTSSSRRVLTSSPFPQPAPVPLANTRLAVGDRVTHDQLGLGRVVKVGDDVNVIVDFNHEDGHLRSITHLSLTML